MRPARREVHDVLARPLGAGGTQPDVIAKLNAAAVDALADPQVRARLAQAGQDSVPRGEQTPDGLAIHYKAETEKWWPIIRAAGIKPE